MAFVYASNYSTAWEDLHDVLRTALIRRGTAET